MSNPLSLFAVYVGIALAIAVFVIAARVVQARNRREVDAEASKTQREALRRAVTAGTHDEQGFLLCRICGDKSKPETRATEYGLLIERSNGFFAWLRERIGAPARLRVGHRYFEGHVYCRECLLVAESVMRSYLLAFEQQLRDAQRDAEVELRRFERVGLDERVKAYVEIHERDMKRLIGRAPATVIPFKAAQG